MNTETDLEVIQPGSAIESMERASIDVQVATAKKYPRTLSVVKAQMLSFATLDIETASGCFFTLPPRKGGDGKPIQGPSVRMAEIALSCFQNLRAGARKIADDGKTITVQGVCHDLQNNVSVSVELQRRVTTKDGRRYSDDMVNMTVNAACSIALRNATFRVVPLALVKPIYEAAKKVAVGDAKTLTSRRADALAHFAKLGVPRENVLLSVGAKTPEDIGLDQLEMLIGYANAIREGDATIEETFPGQKQEAPAPSFPSRDKAADAPPGAEVPPVEKPAQTEQARKLKELRGFLNHAKFTEADILAMWRESGAIDESLASLEDVNEIAPGVIKASVEPWKTTQAALVAFKAKGGAL